MTRLFGFDVGRDRARGRGRLADEFDALCAEADRVGVRWRDLVEDGYRVAGDLYAGGMLVQYDWKWRISELQRRLAEPSAQDDLDD